MKFGFTNLWGENSRTFAPRANINTLITVNIVMPGTTIRSSTSRSQVSVYNSPATVVSERQQRPRPLRAGCLDDEAPDAALRRPVRALQRVDSGGIVAGVDLDRRAQLRRDQERAELERLGGPLRGGVRPDRRRQDGAQGQRRQVRRRAGGRLRADVQRHERHPCRCAADAHAGTTPTATRRSSTPTARIQTNEVLGGTSNFGQVTSRPDPNLPRGYNWEYSVVLQRELRPRLSATAGYYRRDFYNLQVNDNLNVGPSPTGPRYTHQHADRLAAAAGGTADLDVHVEQQQSRRRNGQPARRTRRRTRPPTTASSSRSTRGAPSTCCSVA